MYRQIFLEQGNQLLIYKVTQSSACSLTMYGRIIIDHAELCRVSHGQPVSKCPFFQEV